MPILETIGAGVSILGGLKGLFGKKKKDPTPAQNIVSQAQGARQAAEQYGFNPLTMLQYGNPGGALSSGGGGVAPLASIQMIADGLKDVNDVVSGDADRRRAADQLNLDMARLKYEQARSGVIAAGPDAASTVGAGRSVFGRGDTVQVAQSGGTAQPKLKFGTTPNPVSPERPKDVSEVSNSSGVLEIENRHTGGAISIPGDGEPWGLDELATAVIVGGPQLVWNGMKEFAAGVREHNSNPPEWLKKAKEERDQRDAVHRAKRPRARPDATSGDPRIFDSPYYQK